MMRRKRTVPLRTFLVYEGIFNRQDLYDWLRKRAQPNMSNYGIMVHAWGESAADAVMRWLEVMECHTDPATWGRDQ